MAMMTREQREKEASFIARILMQEAEMLERFGRLPPEMRARIFKNIDASVAELKRRFDPSSPVRALPMRADSREYYEEQWSTACDES